MKLSKLLTHVRHSLIALSFLMGALTATSLPAAADEIQVTARGRTVQFATTMAPARIDAFHVRVNGPDGPVFKHTERDRMTVMWKAEAPVEGAAYRYHVYVTTEGDSKGSTVERMGVLTVEGGGLRPVTIEGERR